jgi:ELWxxDGT repeat protein
MFPRTTVRKRLFVDPASHPHFLCRRPGLEPLESRRLLALTPQMVADVNLVGANSDPAGFVAVGELVYFTATDIEHGLELWQTDGTPEGTGMVKDINPGESNANPRGLTAYNGKLYFFADDGAHGNELWVTDGSAEGTQLVKDIEVGIGGSNSFTVTTAVYNGKLYFNAFDSEHGKELWQTDGTTEGTTLVADIHPGSSSFPYYLTPLAGKLVFFADDGVNGTELWTTDGTAEGTALLQDMLPGPEGSRAIAMTSAGSQLFFRARDPDHGWELWKTDGTTTGTTMVRDLAPGPTDFYPQVITKLRDGLVLFRSGGDRLFRSDGTEEGTYAVDDQLGNVFNLTVLNDKAYFMGADQGIAGGELWVTDGTKEGTNLVADIVPGPDSSLSFMPSITVLNDRLYFMATTPEAGGELWTSDGSAEGTRLVKDINPGAAGGLKFTGFSFRITSAGGHLYFSANDGVTGSEPWVSDGTPAGTRLLKDVNLGTAGSNPKLWAPIGDATVFLADDGVSGAELWTTRGTPGGTQLLKDLQPGSGQSQITFSFGKGFEPINGQLLFAAVGSEFQTTLWKTDGTNAGTTPLVDVTELAQPQLFTKSSGLVYFQAFDADHGMELWKSDGTTAGTTRVKDINPGSTMYPGYPNPYVNSSNPSRLVDSAGTLYFAATDQDGAELWKSDGTEGGTTQVADINPGTYDFYGVTKGIGSAPEQLTPMSDGRLFFTAIDAEHGRELWVTDGTPTGTRLVKDIQTGPGNSVPGGLTVFDGKLYFIADDGFSGRELWVSDGTETGTQLVWDINSGHDGILPPLPSSPYPVLTPAGGRLYFFGNDGVTGSELWMYDPVDEGVFPVKDIRPGLADSVDVSANMFMAGLVAVEDRVYFRANDGQHGLELWTSDGTESGTSMVSDLRPGPIGSEPYAIANVNGTLYFGANDGVHGIEPWRLNDPLTTPVPGDSNRDGKFNSSDLLLVFQIGEYEDGVDNNSTFDDGDWNGDGDFDSSDLVVAFQAGTYVTDASRALIVPETARHDTVFASLDEKAFLLQTQLPAAIEAALVSNVARSKERLGPDSR